MRITDNDVTLIDEPARPVVHADSAISRTMLAPNIVVPEACDGETADNEAAPKEDQPVHFKMVAANRGDAPTEAGVVLGVGFKADGRMNCWSDTFHAPLEPGKSVTLTPNNSPKGPDFIWHITRGLHRITAHVDDVNRIGREQRIQQLRAQPIRLRIEADDVNRIPELDHRTRRRHQRFDLLHAAMFSVVIRLITPDAGLKRVTDLRGLIPVALPRLPCIPKPPRSNSETTTTVLAQSTVPKINAT